MGSQEPESKPKVIVVMPAYNAAKTLRITYEAIPKDDIDHVILVDDGSEDETVKIARELKLEVFVHARNFGYGGNQKTCYTEALKAGADIVVMPHPDYQYDPTLLPELVAPIGADEADVVLGSRFMSGSLELIAQPVEGNLRIHAVGSDPDDNKYIEAAVEGLAQFIVTGDKHLLSLKAYESIRIVTPRVFLDFL